MIDEFFLLQIRHIDEFFSMNFLPLIPTSSEKFLFFSKFDCNSSSNFLLQRHLLYKIIKLDFSQNSLHSGTFQSLFEAQLRLKK